MPATRANLTEELNRIDDALATQSLQLESVDRKLMVDRRSQIVAELGTLQQPDVTRDPRILRG